ncbi:MAG: DUF2306 domain-containing protein [Proteobacteria bacterium]|nr:DUF2306 domain-containing protein [Pseudomonadota bacterium]
MTLEPLLHAPLAVQFHVATVVPAALIGTWQIFFSRKGAPLHRALGWVYLVLMAVTALSTLWVHALMPNGPFFGFSPIHLLIPITFLAIFNAIRAARRHDIPRHRYSMVVLYVAGILVAGGFTFVPGRIMHAVVFGS